MKRKSYMFVYVNINLMDMKQKQVFLQYKFTDPRKYWQHIKPRNELCDIDVTPAMFAEHFSHVYSFTHTCVTQNMLSEEKYDV